MSWNTTLLACLVTGVIFAALSAWLTTRKGNTISDILKAGSLKDAEAIRVEILDKIKLSSNIPIVGLYVVAAAVAVGLPTYAYWTTHRDTCTVVFLSGSVRGPASAGPMHVYPVLRDSYVDSNTGAFKVPLVFSAGEPQHDLTIQGTDYHPLGIRVILDRPKSAIHVQLLGSEGEELVPLQENFASLAKPIQLTPHSTHEVPPDQPSPQPPLPASLAAAAPPPGGAQ
jgi:hypothetical protein